MFNHTHHMPKPGIVGKKKLLFGGKRPCLKKIRWRYALVCLGDDKNNVIADKVLTYF